MVDKLPSTSDYLKEHASNFTPRDEFTAIMAINQTTGRGQRDNTFSSTPGESLTFSFILFPRALTIPDLFFINICVSLGIQDWLLTKTRNSSIKWPNDIIINNKKAGGVLIENTISNKGIKHSIVGIGINVFQSSFSTGLAHKATSLLMNMPDISQMTLQEICKEIIQHIKLRYQHIDIPAEREKALADYNKHLYRSGVGSTFIIDNKEVEGMISHVDSHGLIHIRHGVNNLCTYYLKDISMVL